MAADGCGAVDRGGASGADDLGGGGSAGPEFVGEQGREFRARSGAGGVAAAFVGECAGLWVHVRHEFGTGDGAVDGAKICLLAQILSLVVWVLLVQFLQQVS